MLLREGRLMRGAREAAFGGQVAASVSRDGKFFRLNGSRWSVAGFTYGPFAQGSAIDGLPPHETLSSDLAQMRAIGANCLRLYQMPPVLAAR